MYKQFFLLTLLLAELFLVGCAKIKLGDPAALPGFGEKFCDTATPPACVQKCGEPAEIILPPKFKNGDIVRHKMLKDDMLGIIMQCDYKYIPRLKTYYCIVDFYPSSAIHIDFSNFDDYERRYVYEYELIKEPLIPARWDWRCDNQE
ncbi:MAG: hypothetical protein NTW93_06165 [Phycisphaerae bacterium]|nr:hypothetical protein [Phycisphaerae bacterium]